MKLNIIRIGNSMGIRIPQSVIKQCGFKNSVIVQIKNGKLVLLPDTARKNWDKAFKAMAKADDDVLLDSTLFELDSDKDDWQW